MEAAKGAAVYLCHEFYFPYVTFLFFLVDKGENSQINFLEL